MTEEELEQMTTEHIDREGVANAILKLEIEQLRETLEKAVGNKPNKS